MPRTRTKMTRAEATRYAHRLAHAAVASYLSRAEHLASAVDYHWWYGPDGDLIASALRGIAEHHYRFGPKRTDRQPTGRAMHDTPLLDATLGVQHG